MVPGGRSAQGAGVSAVANPGATVLLLSFGPSRWRWLVEGASQQEVQTAFAGWEMLAVEPADTAGLGWPMNKTAPQWYRLRRRTRNDTVLISRCQAAARRSLCPRTRAELRALRRGILMRGPGCRPLLRR